MNTFVEIVVPTAVLIFTNSLLIFETVKTGKTIKRSDKDKAKRISISIYVAAHTLLYILMNISLAVLMLLNTSLNRTAYFPFAIRLTVGLSSIHKCLHLPVLLVTNVLFRNEAKELIGPSKNKEATSTQQTTKQTVN